MRLAAKLFNVPNGFIAFVEDKEVRFGLNYDLDPTIDRVNRWETLWLGGHAARSDQRV